VAEPQRHARIRHGGQRQLTHGGERRPTSPHRAVEDCVDRGVIAVLRRTAHTDDTSVRRAHDSTQGAFEEGIDDLESRQFPFEEKRDSLETSPFKSESSADDLAEPPFELVLPPFHIETRQDVDVAPHFALVCSTFRIDLRQIEGEGTHSLLELSLFVEECPKFQLGLPPFLDSQTHRRPRRDRRQPRTDNKRTRMVTIPARTAAIRIRSDSFPVRPRSQGTCGAKAMRPRGADGGESCEATALDASAPHGQQLERAAASTRRAYGTSASATWGKRRASASSSIAHWP
jgi:hypothetical protein